MREVMWIAPLREEPGLIAYECPSCKYGRSFRRAEDAWKAWAELEEVACPGHRHGLRKSLVRDC
jgi:hypothetical protein